MSESDTIDYLLVRKYENKNVGIYFQGNNNRTFYWEGVILKVGSAFIEFSTRERVSLLAIAKISSIIELKPTQAEEMSQHVQ